MQTRGSQASVVYIWGELGLLWLPLERGKWGLLTLKMEVILPAKMGLFGNSRE